MAAELVGDAGAAPTITNGCTASVPEPRTSAPVDICWTLYRPAGSRVPGAVVLTDVVVRYRRV